MYSTCVPHKANSDNVVVVLYHDSSGARTVDLIGSRQEPVADGMVDDDVFPCFTTGYASVWHRRTR